jgi:uncharacterized membrane protein
MKLRNLVEKPELVFVYIASFFGLLSASFMPVLAAPDENQHFQVSYAIFSANREVSEDLVKSESLVLEAVRDGSYKNFFTQKTSAEHDGIDINTGSYVFDKKTRASVFDIMHLPQAIGILIGKLIYPSLGVMVLAGRLFTLALYITALYFIIKKIRHGKWVLAFIASFPIMIQQAASVSYDPINLLAIFAWVAFIINVAVQHTKVTRSQIIIGILLALFLLLTKLNNFLLFLLLFATPARHITETNSFKTIRSSRHWTAIKYGFVALFVIIFCLGLYIMSVKLLAGHEFHPRRLFDVLLNTYFWGDLTLIDVTTTGMVGYFSNFYYHLPVWIVIITFIISIVVMLSEKLPAVSRRFALISGILFFGSVLLISVGMYYGWAINPQRLGPDAQVTDGIQGRYFTPLLVLLFPVFAYLQKYIKVATKSSYFVPILVSTASILLLVSYLLQTWHFFWQTA